MIDRRSFLAAAGGMVLAGRSAGVRAADESPVRSGGSAGLLQRPIPGTAETLPVIGMGTSRTFDAGDDASARKPLSAVLETFLAGGATVIDSSPMYGSAEAVTGDLLEPLPGRKTVFMATKVWVDGREAGIAQMNESFRRLGVQTMDLMQVHNLRDWRTHLPTLRQWKDEGRIRYLGITTSVARQHAEFAEVMRAAPWDFVQLNYSLGEREAEKVLLPLAAERGMATLINRPYMRAELFNRVRGRELPAWAADIDCTSWGQFFAKFILGHPAVTCIIPATTSVKNMRDNLAAGRGRLPDEATRRRMVELIESFD